MRILLTNDDGIAAPGMRALYDAALGLGDVQVVAPASVKSAMSHAVTFHKALTVRRQPLCANGSAQTAEGWAVDGTPADCVKLATGTSLCRPKKTDANPQPAPGNDGDCKPHPFDLVISGINSGANIGVNVLYSGTVAAAREASIQGVPAIAVSLHIGDPRQTRWQLASQWTTRVLQNLLGGPLHAGVLLNVNIPILDDGIAPAGLRVLPVNRSPISDIYEEQEGDALDVRSYKAASHLAFRTWPPDPLTDVAALFGRYITISPLQFDTTHHEVLRAWDDHVQGQRS